MKLAPWKSWRTKRTTSSLVLITFSALCPVSVALKVRFTSGELSLDFGVIGRKRRSGGGGRAGREKGDDDDTLGVHPLVHYSFLSSWKLVVIITMTGKRWRPLL